MMASKQKYIFFCLPLWFLVIVEEEGMAKRSSEIARNLLVQKILSTEEIAEVTGLSLDEVREIADGLC